MSCQRYIAAAMLMPGSSVSVRGTGSWMLELVGTAYGVAGLDNITRFMVSLF